MKKTILFFTLLFCFTLAHAQTLLERIVDSTLMAQISARNEQLLSRLDSAFFFDNDKNEFIRPFEPENCVIYDVYNCRCLGEGFANLFLYEEGLIDTNLFTKKYFVSGKFLEDWVDLIEQGKAEIELYDYHDSFVFDTVNDKPYTFPKSEPQLVKIHHVSNNLDTLYCKFGYPIHDISNSSYAEDFLGKLYKTKAIDFVFHFPTFFEKADWDVSKDYVFWSPGYYFAMKGNQFYYIDTQEKKIYPMEEVVENHWDWITNIIEKQ